MMLLLRLQPLRARLHALEHSLRYVACPVVQAYAHEKKMVCCSAVHVPALARAGISALTGPVPIPGWHAIGKQLLGREGGREGGGNGMRHY